MILYLDTSALLKLYLAEADSRRVRRLATGASAIFTHLITYAEMRAALAQALRMRRLSEGDYARQVRAFENDWRSLEIIALDESLVRRAGEHAERFGLRGYDSVHLAAAEWLVRSAGNPALVRFVAFDGALVTAAAAIGLPGAERR